MAAPRGDEETPSASECDLLFASDSFDLLDRIPVYPLVLAVRDDIVSSIDTVYTYDQLGSPQSHQYILPYHPKN